MKFLEGNILANLHNLWLCKFMQTKCRSVVYYGWELRRDCSWLWVSFWGDEKVLNLCWGAVCKILNILKEIIQLYIFNESMLWCVNYISIKMFNKRFMHNSPKLKIIQVSISKRMDEQTWYVQAMEYYSVTETKESLMYVTLTQLRDITCSKRSQTSILYTSLCMKFYNRQN